MMSAAAARRGANGGGWLHAAWMALTGGATPAELLMEEEVAGGGGSSLPVLTVRSSSRYELVSTEEPDGDGTSWEASQLASEAELFLLAREGDPKTTTRSSPESIFACDELRMSKPEFWRLSGKKAIAGDGEPGSKAAVAESEPFLTRAAAVGRSG
ncbi:hypothetical protein E2562_002333 [Oryza meyeriana var. granulata]|uniref:Uncharacterized protein n=1 Tax=Oryza meyeriana var. granulata TaxID=110450 RepID=A0A6G1BI46_9ORYZ|nr:hypothetical protein E2562_002333 [Oryza meyeriana var. granulata]